MGMTYRKSVHKVSIFIDVCALLICWLVSWECSQCVVQDQTVLDVICILPQLCSVLISSCGWTTTVCLCRLWWADNTSVVDGKLWICRRRLHSAWTLGRGRHLGYRWRPTVARGNWEAIFWDEQVQRKSGLSLCSFAYVKKNSGFCSWVVRHLINTNVEDYRSDNKNKDLFYKLNSFSMPLYQNLYCKRIVMSEDLQCLWTCSMVICVTPYFKLHKWNLGENIALY